MRTSQSSGAPTVRYCGNLGHKADDESTLITMRARYYEPTSGRFISEDPGRSGLNWFVYVENNPVEKYDQSGRSALDDMVRKYFMEGTRAIAQRASREISKDQAIEDINVAIRKLKSLANFAGKVANLEFEEGTIDTIVAGPDAGEAEEDAGGLTMGGKAVADEEINQLEEFKLELEIDDEDE